MASWKLKLDSDAVTYADGSGFTFPLNPLACSVPTDKLVTQNQIPFSDRWVMIYQGTSPSPMSVQGIFYTESDYNTLAQYAASSQMDPQYRNVVNSILRLYISDTRFYLVGNSNLQRNVVATNPLGYPYIGNFNRIDPFLYSETESSSTKSGTGVTFDKTADIGTNNGTAYLLPRFEVTNNSGGNIDTITITDTVNTMTWTGTLADGATVKIYQAYMKDNFGPEPAATISGTLSGTISGNSQYIVVPNGTTPLGNITVTGKLSGTPKSTSVKVAWRERNW